jgi:hypothetical protein
VKVFDQQGNAQSMTGTWPSSGSVRHLQFNPVNTLLYVPGVGPLHVYDQNGNIQTLSGTFSGVAAASGVTFTP